VIKGLILAAGRGTRLRPLTDRRPKPLVPIAGRPILQYNIENLRDAGIDDIVIVVNPDSDEVERYFGDGSRIGVRLTYVAQHELRGTAHAVYQARDAIGDSPFILVFGDNMTGYRLRHLAASLEKYSGGSVLAVCAGGDHRKHAVVCVDGDRVCLIEERPEIPRGPYTCAGMYAFTPSIFPAIEKIQPVANGEYYLPHAIQELINDGQPVYYCLAEGWRVNINTPADMMQALAYVVRDMADGYRHALRRGAAPEVLLGANVHLDENVSLGGCSYIGSGCRIGSNSYIGNSMLMENVLVGSDCVVHNAILGQGVVVPDGTRALGDGAPLVVPDGRVITPSRN